MKSGAGGWPIPQPAQGGVGVNAFNDFNMFLCFDTGFEWFATVFNALFVASLLYVLSGNIYYSLQNVSYGLGRIQ